MQSRTDKESQLRRNIEINTERAYRKDCELLGRDIGPEHKEAHRKVFTESANRVDGELHKIWNDKSATSGYERRPELGYFGGVDFDENGKIKS